MNTEIFEISEEEIVAIAGGAPFDLLAGLSMAATAIYPEIDNDRPVPPLL